MTFRFTRSMHHALSITVPEIGLELGPPLAANPAADAVANSVERTA